MRRSRAGNAALPRTRRGSYRPETMRRSTERILTTHVGSLARPHDLLEVMREKEHGRPYDADAYAEQIAAADYLATVAEALREEYLAIVDAGFLLQVDDPWLIEYLGHDDRA